MINKPLKSSGFNCLVKSPYFSVIIFLVKLNVKTIKNNMNAIPKTYINRKLRIDLKEVLIPVIITTAKDDAQGSIPVKIPTVIGLFYF